MVHPRFTDVAERRQLRHADLRIRASHLGGLAQLLGHRFNSPRRRQPLNRRELICGGVHGTSDIRHLDVDEAIDLRAHLFHVARDLDLLRRLLRSDEREEVHHGVTLFEIDDVKSAPIRHSNRKAHAAQQRMKCTPHCLAPRLEFEIAARFGAVHAPATEKRTAQIGGAATFFPQERHVRPRTQFSLLEEAELREQRRHGCACDDVDDIGTAAELRCAFLCHRGLNFSIYIVQETDHAARHGGTRRFEPQPAPLSLLRPGGRAHAQERGKFRRPAAGALLIRARECIFDIRCERRHITAPGSRRSCA